MVYLSSSKNVDLYHILCLFILCSKEVTTSSFSLRSPVYDSFMLIQNILIFPNGKNLSGARFIRFDKRITSLRSIASLCFSCYITSWNSLNLQVFIKVGLSPSKNSCFFASFKNDKKCVLFHFKSSFRSRGMQIFFLAFLSCKANRLIRKIRLISKFMTSQLG